MEAYAHNPYPPYQYAPLAGEEIRFLVLLPSEFGDELRVQIVHDDLSRYKEPPEEPSKEGVLESIAATLSPPWSVQETVDHRLIYFYWNEDAGRLVSSWKHPNPNFDSSSYGIEEKADDAADVKMCAPAYEALSYTWAPRIPEEHIVVEVPESPMARCSHLAAGSNLASALRHLRHRDRPRKLWVDALCINQEDLAERSAQVERMADIYRRAPRVVVWLRPTADDTELAVTTLHYIATQVICTTSDDCLPNPDATEPFWHQPSHSLPLTSLAWQAVGHLIGQSWFDRLWTLQEVVLAEWRAVVRYGSQELPWRSLWGACISLSKKHTLPPQINFAKLEKIYQRSRMHAETDVSSLLRPDEPLECSNPSDHLYGLLALLPPSFRRKLRPDYTWPVGKVFEDLMLKHVEHTRQLQLLPDCQLAGRTFEGCPSWVPDYSMTSRLPAALWCWAFAAGGSACQFALRGANRLAVTGVRCAVVEHVRPASVSDVVPDFQALEVLVTNARSRSRVVDQTSPRIPERIVPSGDAVGTDFCEVFARTVVTDELAERRPNIGVPSRREWIASLNLQQTEPHASGATAWEPSLNCMRATVRGRDYLVTQQGSLVLGPPGAKAGDVVCVLLGCDSPMLLRPVEIGAEASKQDGESGITNLASTCFLVVGQCFALGLRDAQCLLGPFPSRWRSIVVREGSWSVQRFLDLDTKEISDKDPRLRQGAEARQDEDWEPVSPDELRKLEWDDSSLSPHRNKTTGEVIFSKPEWRPEELRKRGVPLEEFVLV